ncbi:hypothetical protein C8R46DRAFT_1030650 [Mycena filopes]|nr:hypothetical protein C8R46DRAFT_1030650 [Mycena filopes]
MTKTAKPGLSGQHKVSYGRPGYGNRAKTVTVNKTGAEIKRIHAARQERIAALSFTQREALLGHGDHDIEMPDAPDFFSADWQDLDSEDEAALQTLPPGEEGYLHSHAGKEETFHQIHEKCRPGRGDPRCRALRVQTAVKAWREQLPYLIDAYLLLKHSGPASSEGAAEGWTIEVIGLDEYGSRTFVHAGNAKRTNETLLRHGYIGASPEKVSLAFPIRLFEIYRQIRRVCPRYSLGSLSTTLTNLHGTPRRAPLPEQLSSAYDAYLEVIRAADTLAHAAMGRDAAWYIHNVCAPCMYRTRNEPRLKFAWLGCMDGNNSLKLVDTTFLAGTARPDNRASTSFRWLSPGQVDVFKDEVVNAQRNARLSKKKKKDNTPANPSAPAQATPTDSTPAPSDSPAAALPSASEPSPHDDDHAPPADADDDDGDVAWLNVNELSGGDAEELAKCLDTCVERWKAAGPEARKKMFSLFAIAGIFLTVCRHGHIVIMCDMIRSGEFGLLDQYGADIGIGYDIMCAFFKTLMRSSLGASVTAMRMQGVVPAFHGHAHNRACQIGWHPLYVDGVGLEDFEECERTFARSNHLASTTRLATPFHRQQQIDEHFHFHDMDKHAASELSTGTELSLLEATLGTTAADYDQYHTTEVKYFQDLKKEPEAVQQTMDYIALLQKHADTIAASADAAKNFQLLDHHIINNGYKKPQITQVRTRYRTTHTRYVAVEEELCRFEEEHLIPVRWTADSAEYKASLTMATERKYRAALAEVERLVVQRLLELTKLGMSGLAYNLREKISKALKTRSEAIHRALITYNEAAALLVPPRERLTFAEVLQTTSIAEFDILRDTWEDIRLQPWTQPARREAMVLHFGIKRAKEEIRRLNVEITRLLTFLVDEHIDYYKAIAATLLVNPRLATELQRRWRHASRVSAAICKRTALTSRLVGFSGSIFPGQRQDCDPNLGDGVPPPYWLATQLGVTTMAVEYEDPDPTVLDDDDESGLVLRGLDVEEDSIVDLMDHLNTFDDE